MKKSHTFRSFISFALFVSFFLNPGSAISQMRDKNKILAGTPPFEIVKKIITTNNTETASPTVFQDKFTPLITWLTDPDVRIQPQLILASPINKLYTCRNMGVQLDVAAASVEYGIRHLHTPILLITSESDNKAIRLFMEDNAELAPAIRKQLQHLKLPPKKQGSKAVFQDRLLQNVEANIDRQVQLAVSRYKDRIEMGRLAVIGSIADFANFYKRGVGRLIIINVNGKTDNDELKNLPIMTSISPELRKLSIGRERIKTEPKKQQGNKAKVTK